jgi:hypothetical protein
MNQSCDDMSMDTYKQPDTLTLLPPEDWEIFRQVCSVVSEALERHDFDRLVELWPAKRSIPAAVVDNLPYYGRIRVFTTFRLYNAETKQWASAPLPVDNVLQLVLTALVKYKFGVEWVGQTTASSDFYSELCHDIGVLEWQEDSKANMWQN